MKSSFISKRCLRSSKKEKEYSSLLSFNKDYYTNVQKRLDLTLYDQSWRIPKHKMKDIGR